MADGFLGRWSRRKLDAKEGRPLAPEPMAPPPANPAAKAPAAVPARGVEEAKTAGNQAAAPGIPAQNTPPEPPPTMADVQALTPASDFSRFTGAQVAPEVRNAAMKKLFSDPHFNVMDGLDIYIDDYGKPDPLPRGMLQSLASAEFLGLVRKDKTAADTADKPSDPLPQGAPEIVAQSGPPEPVNDPADAPDADPDLRLQQDPTPGSQGPGEGAR